MSTVPHVDQSLRISRGTSPAPARRVFITVAEVSGDRHAAQLIRSLRQIDPDIIIEGHGGPEMAAAGAVIHRDTVTNASMGFRAVTRAVEVYRILRWTRRYFEVNRPDIHIGVDSPSMNFHFAKAAHGLGIPTLQYVAPQLWAWAPWRMRKLRRWVDHVACILPFEERYFREHDVNASFVGHPLFDELPAERRPDGEARFPDRAPVIGLLPGSRRSEAEHNFARLLATAEQIQKAFPEARFVVPTTAATHPVVEALLASMKSSGSTRPALLNVSHERDAFDRLVPHCDLCLTVSGTATLHVAGFGIPMIVVYQGSPVLWNLLGRWLIRTRTFSLVNLLSVPSPAEASPARHAVPEFVPWHGPVDSVGQLAVDYLRHPGKLAAQREKLSRLIHALDHPGASRNVAKLAMQLMEKSKSAARPSSNS